METNQPYEIRLARYDADIIEKSQQEARDTLRSFFLVVFLTVAGVISTGKYIPSPFFEILLAVLALMFAGGWAGVIITRARRD